MRPKKSTNCHFLLCLHTVRYLIDLCKPRSLTYSAALRQEVFRSALSSSRSSDRFPPFLQFWVSKLVFGISLVQFSILFNGLYTIKQALNGHICRRDPFGEEVYDTQVTNAPHKCSVTVLNRLQRLQGRGYYIYQFYILLSKYVNMTRDCFG